MRKPAYLLSLTTIALSIIVQPAKAEPGLIWTDADSASLTKKIEAGDYGTITSLKITHKSKVVFENYFNGSKSDSLHNTRSVTKTVTSMAVGRAIADKKLKLDTPVAQYFNDIAPFENPDPRKLKITVEDLLTMSSPLECDDWNNHSRGNEERMYIVENWAKFFLDLPIRDYPSWAQKPSDTKYGRAFAYCTAGVQLLGQVVERATGKPFDKYVEDKIFKPIGLTRYKWPRSGKGQLHMGGGLELTTSGLSKLARLHLNKGRVGNQSILPPDWVAASATPHALVPGDSGQTYGYLWWLRPYKVENADYRTVYMNGNGGNRVYVLPEFDVTIVLTKTDFNVRGAHQKSEQLLDDEVAKRLIR